MKKKTNALGPLGNQVELNMHTYRTISFILSTKYLCQRVRHCKEKGGGGGGGQREMCVRERKKERERKGGLVTRGVNLQIYGERCLSINTQDRERIDSRLCGHTWLTTTNPSRETFKSGRRRGTEICQLI